MFGGGPALPCWLPREILASGPGKNMEDIVLRQWRDSDLPPFAEMNADPEVMRHFPALLTHSESEAALRRMLETFARAG